MFSSSSSSHYHNNNNNNNNNNSIVSLFSSLTFYNYLKFCLTFSITHATVDGVLIYITSQLGKNLGSISSSLLYFMYSFSALFLSKLFLNWKGSKISLLYGMFLLLIYVTSFFIALIIPTIKWYVCIPGSIIGGIGAGIMWPSQGMYFSENASKYSYQKQLPIDQVQNLFGGYFASIYLGIEGIGKLFVTLVFLSIPNGQWKFISFLVYTIISWISTLYCTTITKFCLPQQYLLKEYSIFQVIYSDLLSIYNLLTTDPIFIFILPYQITFGICSSYISYNINGILLPNYNKEGYIGGLNASSILIGAILMIPITLLTSSSSFSSSSISSSNGLSTSAHLLSQSQSSSSSSSSNDSSSDLTFTPHSPSNSPSSSFESSSAPATTISSPSFTSVRLSTPSKIFPSSTTKSPISPTCSSLLPHTQNSSPNSTINNNNNNHNNNSLLSSSPSSSCQSCGLYFVMLLGPLLFGICGVIGLFFSNNLLDSWYYIIPIILSYGIGRAIWENTNKSILVIIFHSNYYSNNSTKQYKDSIFSMIYFTSGISGGIGYILFRFIPLNYVCILVISFSILSCFGNYYCVKYRQQIIIY